jgi:hypothetical protein
MHLVAIVQLLRILVLRVDIGERDLLHIRIVGANAAVEDFVQAGCDVERPTLGRMFQRDRKRPFSRADRGPSASSGLVSILARRNRLTKCLERRSVSDGGMLAPFLANEGRPRQLAVP